MTYSLIYHLDMKDMVFIVLFALCINGYFALSSVKHPTLFIINGNPVPEGKYPFMVSIQRNGRNICGGVIITESIVVSAAHCFFMNPDYRNLKIVTGIVDLHSVSVLRRQERKITDSIQIHPNFRNTYLYDIALFKVDRPFKINYYVNTVRLVSEPSVYRGIGYVAGWGRTREDDETSESSTLLEAPVTILSHRDCIDEYGEDVNKGLLCSLPFYQHEDACQGDSGGPLIRNGKLTGIISAGIGCGSAYQPGVLTDVYYFVNWINYTISNWKYKQLLVILD